MSNLPSPALSVPAERAAPASPAPPASITLDHVLTGMGADHNPAIRPEDVHVIRHVFRPDGLRGPEDRTEERVLAYTRKQDISPRSFPSDPPRYWVAFIRDGQKRSRLWVPTRTTAS